MHVVWYFTPNESPMGAFSMGAIHEGLYSNIFRDVPHLLDIHCIDHREALAVNDVLSHFP